MSGPGQDGAYLVPNGMIGCKICTILSNSTSNTYFTLVFPPLPSFHLPGIRNPRQHKHKRIWVLVTGLLAELSRGVARRTNLEVGVNQEVVYTPTLCFADMPWCCSSFTSWVRSCSVGASYHLHTLHRQQQRGLLRHRTIGNLVPHMHELLYALACISCVGQQV
jgi:hypothetical protein